MDIPLNMTNNINKNNIKSNSLFQTKEISNLFIPYINNTNYPSRSSFGKSFVNGVKHWWYPSKIIQDSYDNDKLMILDLEFGNICGLRCEYCFRSNDERDLTHRDDLNLAQWENLIDQASDMGVKGVKLIGAGEFFEDRRFMDAFSYLTDKGLKAVLFTGGNILDDEEKMRRLHGMGSEEIIDYLFQNDHTIFIKGDSFRESVMDKLVKKSGFTQSRNKVLERLIQKGFTNETPTRLGLEVQVNKYTLPELLDIDKLKHHLNIYSDMVTSMPCGLYDLKKANGTSIDISMKEKKELYQKIYEQNIKFGIPFEEASPFIGGLSCSQLGNGLYINVIGNVYSCPGYFDKIGNVKETSLKQIWKSHINRRKFQDKGYICPPRENSGITPTNLYSSINKKLISKK